MKKSKKLIILIGTFLVIAILSIIGWIVSNNSSEDEGYVGNNSYGYSLQLGVGQAGYETPEEAIESGNQLYDSDNILYTGGMNDYKVFFWQDKGNIIGEEVYEKDGKYYYIGNVSINFCFRKQIGQTYGFEDTFEADVHEMVKIHTDSIPLKKKYGALPVWGVSDSEQVKEKEIDVCVPFSYLDQEYYLWYIADYEEK